MLREIFSRPPEVSIGEGRSSFRSFSKWEASGSTTPAAPKERIDARAGYDAEQITIFQEKCENSVTKRAKGESLWKSSRLGRK